MNSYNPLPEIKIIPLTSGNQEMVAAPTKRGRPVTIRTAPTDIRWLKVREFLNSSNLAPNTHKVYERELKRFLAWTELLWGEIKPRHISQYKAYLMEEVRKDLGQPHVTRRGERLSYHGIYFAVEKIGELALIPNLHPHRKS